MYMYLLTCTLYIALFLPMYIIQYLHNGMHIDVFPLFINLYESVIHLHYPEDNFIYTLHGSYTFTIHVHAFYTMYIV